jgi:hypothetical protein
MRHSRAGKWLLRLSLGSVFVLVVRWVLNRFADNLFTVHVEPHVIAFVKWFVAQPVGVVLLVCAVWFFLLAAWTAYDGSQWAAHRRALKPKRFLSDEERKLIQDIRTVWNRYGEMPVSAIADQLGRIASDLRERRYWAPLLTPQIEQLNRARSALRDSLGSKSEDGIGRVRNLFNDMYTAYLQSCCWLARMNEAGDIDVTNEPGERYMMLWRAGHNEFFDRLQDVVQIPEHDKTLSIFPQSYSETAAYLAKLLTPPTPRVIHSEPQPLTKSSSVSLET